MNARTTVRIFSLLLAGMMAACARADVLDPSLRAALADDYAVWGAALDLEVDGTREAGWPVLLVDVARPYAGEPNGFTERGMRRFAPRYPIDDAMIAAFLAADSTPVRVSPAVLGRHTGVTIAGVRRENAAPLAWPKQADGNPVPVVSMSRVAYDASRRHALVSVFWGCGSRCGHGTLQLMEKDAGGRWRRVVSIAGMRS